VSWKRTLAPTAAFLLALSLGCSPRHPGEIAFDQLLSSEDANTSIALSPISVEIDDSSGVFVSLQLQNNSTEAVAFPPGYGARGFLWSDKGRSWSEISNEIVFPEVGYELGPSGGDVPYIGTANFASSDPQLLGARSIRLLVEGSLLDRDGLADGPISAYVDAELPGG